ncbi:hypothetical protein ACTXT7_001483 [Hymenolepis weldensis]
MFPLEKNARLLRLKGRHTCNLEETYRDGGRRTSGLIITYFVAKLACSNTFFEASDRIAT